MITVIDSFSGEMMRILFTAMIFAAFAGLGIYLHFDGQPTVVESPLPMPAYGEITVKHAAPLFYDGLPEGYAVVDVRTAEEFQTVHVVGTVNIPVNIFEESNNPCRDLVYELPKAKKIIFICNKGIRSADMYYNLTDPEEDLGCGIDKTGLYYLNANVQYNMDRLIIKASD